MNKENPDKALVDILDRIDGPNHTMEINTKGITVENVKLPETKKDDPGNKGMDFEIRARCLNDPEFKEKVKRRIHEAAKTDSSPANLWGVAISEIIKGSLFTNYKASDRQG